MLTLGFCSFYYYALKTTSLNDDVLLLAEAVHFKPLLFYTDKKYFCF